MNIWVIAQGHWFRVWLGIYIPVKSPLIIQGNLADMYLFMSIPYQCYIE